MRTTVEIDEELLREARMLSGGASIKETINRSLREYVRKKKLMALADSLGTYEVNLDHDTLERLRER